LRATLAGDLRVILSTVLNICYLLLGLTLLCTMWRLWQGPSLPDRIMALDKLYINVAAVLILLGIDQDTTVYFEAALIIALMGFIGTVAACKYLNRGNILK
ncbi:MAG: K+/H+ antiporter subunit F, partial [Candidatus Competibacterales bacterium]|nr:K+/H+ antiporter subunit F [Candidatus Competibacterales bacterium]